MAAFSIAWVRYVLKVPVQDSGANGQKGHSAEARPKTIVVHVTDIADDGNVVHTGRKFFKILDSATPACGREPSHGHSHTQSNLLSRRGSALGLKAA